MKMYVLLIHFAILVCISAFGQSGSNYIKYDYDAAGNRISRKCLQITLRSVVSPNDTIGVDEILNDFKVTIYPNPTKGALEVGLSIFVPDRKVEFLVYTADGKCIKRMTAQSVRTLMDLSAYSSGMYLLLVTEGDRSIECKIIKQ